jgi:hypothetical protein
VSIELDIFDTIKTLVSNRVYPNTFVQPNGSLPVFPAIRYQIISNEVTPDICGDGLENEQNPRVQLDLACFTGAEVITLRENVRAAMKNFPDSPALLEDSGSDYDADTKTHRVRMDYVIYQSTI